MNKKEYDITTNLKQQQKTTAH